MFNVLLQVMDYGKLTDHNGRSVDFRNVILCMTTNAGAADIAKPALGFGREARHDEDVRHDDEAAAAANAAAYSAAAATQP